MNEYYNCIIISLLKQDVIDHFNLLIQNEKTKHVVFDEIEHYFNNNKIVLKEEYKDYGIKQNKGHIYRDRIKYQDKTNRCLARIWNCGMGGQCSRKGIIDGFCKGHAEPKYGDGKDGWWLGTIDQPRPERPIHYNNKIHQWIN